MRVVRVTAATLGVLLCWLVLGDVGHLTTGSMAPFWGSSQVVLVVVAVLLTLMLLRRLPEVVLGMLLLDTVSVSYVFKSGAFPIGQFLLVVAALAYLTAVRPRATSVPAALVATLVLLGSSAIRPVGPTSTLAVLLAVGLAWLLGNTLRERRTHAASLQAQATLQAVTAERLRIARELHDVVAHSIGVIAIQAGMGSRVFDSQPEEARLALTAIEQTSRETLAGLRTTLGSLRRNGDGETAPLAPAPGLADLGRLVETTRDAGVRVDLTCDAPQTPPPADVDLAAFRIVQEALTNVVRHAHTDFCRVSVVSRNGELVLEVVDDGTGGPTGLGGYGLLGMRERVELLGGELWAGPRAEGGFRVAARLPVRS